MLNFVARFLPNMSTVTAPLRELLKKYVAFVSTEQQQTSFEALRESLTKAPVLAYFDKHKPVTLSVDASKTGVGTVILQRGQPVAHSLRSPTETLQRYPQIEKEMLAIVQGCRRF